MDKLNEITNTSSWGWRCRRLPIWQRALRLATLTDVFPKKRKRNDRNGPNDEEDKIKTILFREFLVNTCWKFPWNRRRRAHFFNGSKRRTRRIRRCLSKDYDCGWEGPSSLPWVLASSFHTGILLCRRSAPKINCNWNEKREPERSHGKIRKMLKHSGRVIQTPFEGIWHRTWGSTSGRENRYNVCDPASN